MGNTTAAITPRLSYTIIPYECLRKALPTGHLYVQSRGTRRKREEGADCEERKDNLSRDTEDGLKKTANN